MQDEIYDVEAEIKEAIEVTGKTERELEQQQEILEKLKSELFVDQERTQGGNLA
jgi:hypothetical protein